MVLIVCLLQYRIEVSESDCWLSSARLVEAPPIEKAQPDAIATSTSTSPSLLPTYLPTYRMAPTSGSRAEVNVRSRM